MNNIINLTKMSFTNLKSVYKQIWFIWIVWIGVAIFNPFFLNMLFGLSILLTLYQVMAYEDNNGINYLISFLPVKRSEYVISRYLLGIGSLLLSIIVIYIVHLVSTQINPLKEVPIKILLPISITSAILAMSVIIPLVLKFGINKGRVFMSIIIMVIAMAPISIISYISKNPKMIDNIMNIINNIGLPIIAILINIVMILISICISIKLYQNKEIKE
ncbi:MULTISPECIES: ABC-2 transporter permease [Romboutsia]|jgi:ABC-2 type transport system permease protein|uniref:ABC-2 transporter permease n=1 Tax=Romboutsia TaxID=1501226 RepID=UPI0021741566|nr:MULTISPECIES: ABC-2 transporter permease [Romboutsia]MCI9061924.1 ABC-2 transporter permease [Romboutsia sp.]MCI9260763.1 ABC-2 transporter permease [Romboutsia sp.]